MQNQELLNTLGNNNHYIMWKEAQRGTLEKTEDKENSGLCTRCINHISQTQKYSTSGATTTDDSRAKVERSATASHAAYQLEERKKTREE